MLFASAFFLKEITALLEDNFWYKLIFLEIKSGFVLGCFFIDLNLKVEYQR